MCIDCGGWDIKNHISKFYLVVYNFNLIFVKKQNEHRENVYNIHGNIDDSDILQIFQKR